MGRKSSGPNKLWKSSFTTSKVSVEGSDEGDNNDDDADENADGDGEDKRLR